MAFPESILIHQQTTAKALNQTHTKLPPPSLTLSFGEEKTKHMGEPHHMGAKSRSSSVAWLVWRT